MQIGKQPAKKRAQPFQGEQTASISGADLALGFLKMASVNYADQIFSHRLMVLRERERVLPSEEEWRVFWGVRESKVEVKYLDTRNPRVLQ